MISALPNPTWVGPCQAGAKAWTRPIYALVHERGRRGRSVLCDCVPRVTRRSRCFVAQLLLDEESRTLSLLTKQNALSPVAAIALTVVMGICLALANPLLLRLGVAHGGWLELALGVALCAAVGY